MDNFIWLADDIGQYVKDQNNSQLNNYFSEKGSNGFHILDTGFSQVWGGLIRIGDVILVLMLLIGMGYMIYSNIGNSGEARRKGVGVLVSIYGFLMFIHLFVTAKASSPNLSGGRLTAFAVMLIGQFVSMSGSIILYAFGTVYLQVYTMTGQETYKRKARTAYTTMLWVIVGSGLAVLFTEVIAP